MASKPRLFIGSSVEGLSIAYAVQDNLKHTAEVTVWPQGVFELSATTIESLIHIVNSFDFGIFVFSADDAAKIRGKTKLVTRDNVLFELGLFIGKLGRDRVFIVIPENNSKLHIPTDLLGINPGKFEDSRSDNNLQAGTASFCNQARIAINALGKIKNNATIDEFSDSKDKDTVIVSAIPETPKSNIDWLTLYDENKFIEAIKEIESLLKTEKNVEKIDSLHTGLIQCKLSENFLNARDYINTLESKNNPKDYFYVISAYLNEGYLDYASTVLDTALNTFPLDDNLIISKVSLLEMRGLSGSAITYLESISDPSEIILLNLSQILFDRKDKFKSIQVMHKAFLKYPASTKIAERFAYLANELERYKLAIFLYDSLVRQFPNDATYLTYYGSVAIHLSLYDIAIRSYRRAIEMTGEKQSWIFSNLGNVLKVIGAYEDSKVIFKKSLELGSDSAYVYNRLGELMRAQEADTKLLKNLIKEGRTSAFADVISVKLEEDEDNDLPF